MPEELEFSPSLSPSASASPSPAPPEEVEERDVQQAKKGVEGTPAKKEDLDRLYYIMLALVIALLVGFASTFVAAAYMLYDGFTNKAESYQSLVEKINNQEINNLNIRIDDLNVQLKQIQDCQKKPINVGSSSC